MSNLSGVVMKNLKYIILLFLLVLIKSQTLSGKIIDHLNSPIPYLNFKLYSLGKEFATMTDETGNFKINFLTNIDTNNDLPKDYEISNNYPNPFNPSTRINLKLPKKSTVKLCIYNVLGQLIKEVVNQEMETGIHNVDIHLDGYSNGLYIARFLIDKQYSIIRKLMLVYGSQHLQNSSLPSFNTSLNNNENKIIANNIIIIDSIVIDNKIIGKKVIKDLPYLDLTNSNLPNIVIDRSCPDAPPFIHLGMDYNPIQIGDQCWLDKNMDIGNHIDFKTLSSNNGIIEKYCLYNNPDYCEPYGGLYQWREAMQYSTVEKAKGICPPGWHIPSYSEFSELNRTIEYNSKLLFNYINSTGFRALLAGYLDYTGIFRGERLETSYWSSTASITGVNVFNINTNRYGPDLVYQDNFQNSAYSVRCIKDEYQLTDIERTLTQNIAWQRRVISSTDPAYHTADLLVLDKFGTSSIIGLGESAYGVKEFNQMKHRLFRYFVQKFNFEIFAIEADLSETIYINRFIQNSIGDIEFVMNKMSYWTTKNKDIKDLILWMKEYNSSKAESEKIFFLGIDCSSSRYLEDLVVEYLNKYNTNNYPENIKKIALYLEENSERILPSFEINEFKKKADTLLTYFSSNQSTFVAKSGVTEFNLIYRLIEQTKQVIEVSNFQKFGEMRDFYMAENVLWLNKLLTPNTKVMVSSHNNNINKYSKSMGSYIVQKIGNNYKAFTFSFGKGSFWARNYDLDNDKYLDVTIQNIAEFPIRNSYNYVLSSIDNKNYYFDLSSIPIASSVLVQWFSNRNNFLSITTSFSSKLKEKYYENISLNISYDVLFQINKINASENYE